MTFSWLSNSSSRGSAVGARSGASLCGLCVTASRTPTTTLTGDGDAPANGKVCAPWSGPCASSPLSAQQRSSSRSGRHISRENQLHRVDEGSPSQRLAEKVQFGRPRSFKWKHTVHLRDAWDGAPWLSNASLTPPGESSTNPGRVWFNHRRRRRDTQNEWRTEKVLRGKGASCDVSPVGRAQTSSHGTRTHTQQSRSRPPAQDWQRQKESLGGIYCWRL